MAAAATAAAAAAKAFAGESVGDAVWRASVDELRATGARTLPRKRPRGVSWCNNRNRWRVRPPDTGVNEVSVTTVTEVRKHSVSE